MESEVRFELFPDDSLEEEFWRFIVNRNISEHLFFVEKEK